MKTIKEYSRNLRFWSNIIEKSKIMLQDINKELNKFINVNFENCNEWFLLTELKSSLLTDLYMYKYYYDALNKHLID